VTILIQRLQVNKGFRNKLVHHPYNLAIVEQPAITAGFKSPGVNTFPDLTNEAVTEFYTRFTTACTVDHIRGDVRGIMLYLPFFGSGSTKFIIVGNRSLSGITGGTVETAAGDEF
jgi:hypothetical protein